MTRVWNLCPSLESLRYFDGLRDPHVSDGLVQPSRFALVNREAFRQHWDRLLFGSDYDACSEGERELLEFDGMPTPAFRIADSAFKLDYFQEARLYCASLRLRQALALTDDIIRYRDIDLVQSPPTVRAQEYQAFQVVAFADPIDWTKTPGQFSGFVRPDGSVRRYWHLAPPNPVNPSRIYWRDDFRPPAPLFRVVGTGWMLATDALADKVMRAGITDLTFQDMMSDRAQSELVLRQL
jgi:hypothetical protein